MSKRIAIYVNEDELDSIIDWARLLESTGEDHLLESDIKLKERLEAELATFEE